MLFENKSLCGKHAKEIVCSENNKVFKAYNRQNHIVYKFKIDGDVLTSSDSRNRCDYLVEDETKKRAYLIELKGTQLLHALDAYRKFKTKYPTTRAETDYMEEVLK